jgi:uncharacterized repeat protein (TIGR03806 family)
MRNPLRRTATLSQTGTFSDAARLAPASGLIPYTVNVPLWSDGASKLRWMSVPYTGSTNEQIGFAPTGEWQFPTGTVFVKHFEIATDETNPNAQKRRLETRILVRDAHGAAYGVTYKWRPDGTEADLLSGRVSEDILITNSFGVRTQTWFYPSSLDCLTCHTPEASFVLGVKTRQLNGNLSYPPTGVTDNQLRALNHIGMFNPAIDESSISNLSQLVPSSRTKAPLADRARSYLDANCSQCHRPGGSASSFDARWDTPLENQNITNKPAVKGNLGIDNAQVVAPKDIWRSILYQRCLSLTASIKMPPLARNIVDTNNMAMIGDWINSLPGIPAVAPPVMVPNGGVFNSAPTVALLAQDTNSTTYYTLDGTLPTQGAFLYSGPFQITSNLNLYASAFRPGFNNSVAVHARFTIIPPPVINSESLRNALFGLGVSGPVGNTYVLQASPDLRNWTALGTNFPSTSSFTFAVPVGTNLGPRFYRVLQLP